MCVCWVRSCVSLRKKWQNEYDLAMSVSYCSSNDDDASGGGDTAALLQPMLLQVLMFF